MSIGGIVETLSLVEQSDILYMDTNPEGFASLVLRGGSWWEHVTCVRQSVTFNITGERTASGYLYVHTLQGELSPVSLATRRMISRLQQGGVVAVVNLKGGGAIVMGNKSRGCVLSLSGDVSGDYSTNSYAFTLTFSDPHQAPITMPVL